MQISVQDFLDTIEKNIEESKTFTLEMTNEYGTIEVSAIFTELSVVSNRLSLRSAEQDVEITIPLEVQIAEIEEDAWMVADFGIHRSNNNNIVVTVV